MKRFKGFTLTELMIALAVIGILVAIVTPAIMKTRPNKNKMMVKKTFYAAEQIISSLINDEVLYPDMRDACRTNTNNGDVYCAWGFDYTSATSFEGSSYSGPWKFAALFKERLNVKNNTASSKIANATPDNNDFYPIFTTSDGVLWDLTKTGKINSASASDNTWVPRKTKVGTFDDNLGADKANFPGVGTILIDVDTSNDTQTMCTATNEDCDSYEIQILANGKLRINPDHIRAVNWTTINTAIKDN